MSIITCHGILSINGNKTLSRHLSGTPVIILSDILHHIKSSLTNGAREPTKTSIKISEINVLITIVTIRHCLNQ